MALEYFLYNTLYNNTLIDRSKTSFAPLPPDTGEIFIDFFIPEIQPLYLYRESGGTIIENDQQTVDTYIEETAPPPTENDPVNFNTFTGYSATTNSRLETVEIQSGYALSTGIITGGTISSASTTTLDISDGFGYVVQPYLDVESPPVTKVNISGKTGVAITNISTQNYTHVSIDKNGNVIQRKDHPNGKQARDEIFLGVVYHENGSIDQIINNPYIGIDVGSQLNDYFNFTGFVRKTDRYLVPEPNNDLTLQICSGITFIRSDNYNNVGIQNPHIKEFPAQNPINFIYANSTGSTGTITTQIDPTKYEPNGSGSVVNITGTSNTSTIQRLYLTPQGDYYVLYGQETYPSVNRAVERVLVDQKDFTPNEIVSDQFLLIGVIAVRSGATNLNNVNDAVFITVDKFGNIIGGNDGNFFALDNYTVIKSVNDFPIPSGNEIQLEDNYIYQINGTVDIGSNKLVGGENSQLFGKDAALDIIIGNRSDSLVEITNHNFTTNNLTYYNINTNGDVFDLSSNGTDNLIMDRIFVTGSSFGQINNYGVAYLTSLAFFGCIDGIRVSGGTAGSNTTKFKVDALLTDTPQSGFTAINILGGSFAKVNLSNNFFFLSNGVTGITAPEGLDVVSGILINNEFVETETGGTLITGGFNKAEVQWFFTSNQGLNDSLKFGYLKFEDNATATNIPSTANYYKAEGTNDFIKLERFVSGGTNNRLQYSGGSNNPSVEFNSIVTGNLTVGKNNQSVLVHLFKNGTTDIGGAEVFVNESGVSVAFALNEVGDLINGDYLEIYVRNLSGTNDITVQELQFEAREI